MKKPKVSLHVTCGKCGHETTVDLGVTELVMGTVPRVPVLDLDGLVNGSTPARAKSKPRMCGCGHEHGEGPCGFGAGSAFGGCKCPAWHSKKSGMAAERRAIAQERGDVSVGDGTLAKGERAVLTAIAQYPKGVTHEQLAVLTGYKRRSRDTYISRLTAAGFAFRDGSRTIATDAGRSALGNFKPLPTGAALVKYWRERLSGGELLLFDAVLGAGKNGIDKPALCAQSGYAIRSVDTYLSRLRARQLVEVDSGIVTPSPMLP